MEICTAGITMKSLVAEFLEWEPVSISTLMAIIQILIYLRWLCRVVFRKLHCQGEVSPIPICI